MRKCNIYLGKLYAQMNTFTWENCVRKYTTFFRKCAQMCCHRKNIDTVCMFLYYPLPLAHRGEVAVKQDIFVDVLKSHVCICTHKMSDCPFSVQVNGSGYL